MNGKDSASPRLNIAVRLNADANINQETVAKEVAHNEDTSIGLDDLIFASVSLEL